MLICREAHYLDSDLWQVVWVAQLGCDVEAEFTAVLNGRVAQANAVYTTALEDLQGRGQSDDQLVLHL